MMFQAPGNARPQQSGNSYGGSQQTSGFSQANWGNPSSIQALTEPGKSKKSKDNDYAYGGSASHGSMCSETTVTILNVTVLNFTVLSVTVLPKRILALCFTT